MLALLLGAEGVRAQQATIREMRETAFRQYARGEFADAIPTFTLYIEQMKDVKSSQELMALEPVFYNLSLCYFLTGDFGQADKAFQAYNKKFPRGSHVHEALVYIADCRRLSGRFDEAIKAYEAALKQFSYAPDLRTDIYASIARCYLARDDWKSACTPLLRAFNSAPDGLRRNRAATLLATAYLKTLTLEKIYPMVPYLLQRDSLAARSIAFNMAALEAGDALFQEERYREAFWVHRLVYPYDEVIVRTEAFQEYLQKRAEYEQRYLSDPRKLMRIQEWLGECEAELKAIKQIDNYDVDLYYRIARGYMEAQRYREACELFLHLHAVGGQEKAEEALYLAFQCATRILPWQRAYVIGNQYMEKFPSGKWFDELSLMMGQMYAKELNWPETIRHFSEVLRVRPNHQSASECLFLLGYAHFMEEQFEQAIVRLRELRTRFPEWEQLDGAVYWTAMALMFKGEYADAATDFDLLVSRYAGTIYMEDASYRRAVCNYALAQYELADERLSAFLKTYPQARLAAEANMMRGDIAGALGRIDDAVGAYQRALEFPDERLNIEYYNHCAFQAGQILFDHERFTDVRAHFQRYMDRKRPESNIPLAVYWVGRALFQLGEVAGTARFYKDAVVKYGADRKQVGVDMILDEWVATTRRLPPEQAAVAWDDVVKTVRDAAAAGDKAAVLRFTRVLMFKPDIVASARDRLLSVLLQPENVTNASPAVLETMLDGAVARGQTNLALSVAQTIITDFTETDYALDARMFLAKNAMVQAREAATPEAARPFYDEAIKQLTVVREVYATTGEASQALLLLGQLYLEQGKPDEADACFESVLGVRGWSPSWPEALLGRGQCAEARKNFLKATAYYERIYVMYSNYRSWTAKAYLRRADALRRAYQDAKAVETLREMMKNEDLAKYPEYEQAKAMLAKLGSN
jgi:TolA-binding protein